MNDMEALKKLQETELDILLMLKDFCDTHSITWFLDGGTTLGAARHGGFIPWDDDIDIGMIREEYDRFITLAKTELPEGYSLHDISNTQGYAAMFAKVYKDGTEFHTDETMEAGCNQGIFVDVFPYDRLAKDAGRRKKQIRNARTWQSILYLYHSRTIVVPHRGVLGAIERGGCKIAHTVVRAAFHPNAIREKFERSIISNNEETIDRFITLPWPNISGFDKNVLTPPVPLKFEGYEFPAPAQPEKYLETTYGAWQNLPPIEDRHTHLPKHLDFGDGITWSRL